MRLALVASAGWLAVGAVLAGAPVLACAVVIAIAAYAFFPEPCVDGHRIRTVEYRDARLQWYWSAWRCVRCGRLTDDVRPGWMADR